MENKDEMKSLLSKKISSKEKPEISGIIIIGGGHAQTEYTTRALIELLNREELSVGLCIADEPINIDGIDYRELIIDRSLDNSDLEKLNSMIERTQSELTKSYPTESPKSQTNSGYSRFTKGKNMKKSALYMKSKYNNYRRKMIATKGKRRKK